MIREVKLDRFQIATKAILDSYALHDVSVTTYEDMLGNLVLKLQADVLAYVENDSLVHTDVVMNTITRPRFANPWEHLKARWAGRAWFAWYVKRYPVKFTEEKFPVSVKVDIDLQELVTFPECKYVFPPQMGHPTIMVREKGNKIQWSGPVDRIDPLV